jgi:ubiquinol-cytochrome c reductase iron-sulfur subunit
MSTNEVDLGRRRFLTTATTVVGGVGALFALTPFLSAWKPSARAQAAGAPVQVDVSLLDEGQQMTVEWRGRPIWIVRRSKQMLAELPKLDSKLRDPNSEEPQQPNYAVNGYRSIKPEFLVAVGLCTHLGCVPSYRPTPASVSPTWPGGFYCPCHGSLFDMAGRVYKGVPAPTNLIIPPYKYLNEKTILVGDDEGVSV